MARIHPTAVVDARARLGGDVEVGPFAYVGGGVELGSGVSIGAYAAVTGRTLVGAGTRVFPHAVVGGEPQLRGWHGEPTGLVIGENNVIREFVTIHEGSLPGAGGTRIGDHNLLMNNVHVAHDSRIGSHCVLASFTALGGHAVFEDHVVTGAMTGVHQYVRMGESAFSAANSMVPKDAPPFARVAGDRARFAGLNTLGLQRRSFSGETIAALKHAFHVLFLSKLRFEPAAARVEAECGQHPEVARLLSFLRASERGFIR